MSFQWSRAASALKHGKAAIVMPATSAQTKAPHAPPHPKAAAAQAKAAQPATAIKAAPACSIFRG